MAARRFRAGRAQKRVVSSVVEGREKRGPVKGQNSHDGGVFRRTEDQLPRGNGTLMLKIAFHDYRKRIYDSIGRLVDTPAGALAFMDCYIDRTEGRPTKKIEKTVQHESRFVFTTKDGEEIPALPAPQKVGGDATAAASTEDLVILGPELGKA